MGVGVNKNRETDVSNLPHKNGYPFKFNRLGWGRSRREEATLNALMRVVLLNEGYDEGMCRDYSSCEGLRSLAFVLCSANFCAVEKTICTIWLQGVAFFDRLLYNSKASGCSAVW